MDLYRFNTFLGVEILFFIKQCPLKFMSGNTWWWTKVGAKLMSDLVIFSIFSSSILPDIYESIRVVALKHLTYFLAGTNTKKFWNIPDKKYFALLRILNLLIMSFVNPFVDIAVIFLDSYI